MPEVSLIIPMYNVAPYLKRCIESIAAQTFSDFEAIFVNDGSPDDSFDLCKKLISPYKYMRVVSKENGGLSSARLFGYLQAKGNYISFIDSDDYLHPDYLKELHSAITSEDADMSLCAYYLDSGYKITENKLFYQREKCSIPSDKILQEYILPQLTSFTSHDKILPSFMWLRMFRKDILKENYFISERKVYQEDLAMSLLIYKSIKRISVINKPLYYYCVNAGSLTLKYREKTWEMMCNLYGLIEKNIYSNDIESCNRKKAFVMEAILFAFRNESLKNFKACCQVNKKIRANQIVRKTMQNIHFCEIDKRKKVLFLLWLLHLTPLLYFKHKYF